MDKQLTIITEAYNKMYNTTEIINEGGLGILLGGLAGLLLGGPIGAVAGAYIGHKAQEFGVGKSLKYTLAIVGGSMLGGIFAGPLGSIAGAIGGFSIAKNESVEEINEKQESKNALKETFKDLFKALDKFMKDKSPSSLKNAVTAVNAINKESVISKLDKINKDRLTKLYVFIITLNALIISSKKEDRVKFEKLFKAQEKDIINTVANIINDKK